MLSDAGSPPLDKISDRRPQMRKTTKESLDYMPRTFLPVCTLSGNNFLMCLSRIMLSDVVFKKIKMDRRENRICCVCLLSVS